MKFNMDHQSYKDLNVFTSGSDGDAIFNLFKLTKTIGGREMLSEMMSNPSSNLVFLQNRVDTIRWFEQTQFNVDMTNHQLDLIEHYLKHDKLYLKANLIDASADALKNKLFPSNDYYIISTGIKNLLKLFKTLATYQEFISENEAPDVLEVQSDRLSEILELPMMKRIISLDPSKLKFYHISEIDSVFRKTLKKELREILRIVYELDVYECLAYLLKHKGLCLPNYLSTEELNISVEGLYHPGIKNAVANDVTFRAFNNMTFLTGSNMAGKSSFLKAAGLAVYLAHIGFPIFARSMNTTTLNGMITTINLPDNLQQGLSHYYSEVKRVKEAAIQLRDHKKILIIFDELFRGTNVKDAFDASLLVLSELTKVKHSVFLISTHIVELAQELAEYENISFKYMDTYFKGDKPVFTYKLMEGISKERLGMYIVKNEGIVEIIQQAI